MSSGSPFTQHLHTNYVPSTIEINQLRSLVDERQKVVDALDREIEALVNRRDEHAKFVEEHSALLSPIRRVPSDVLSLIFLACLPCYSSARRHTRLSGDHPALVVSQVCQRWRHLSFNTPLLWTIIDIYIPRAPDSTEYMWDDAMAHWGGHVRAIFEMTQFWISRSASCPLTVSFSGGFTFAYHTNFEAKSIDIAREQIRCIVDALCDVSRRWRSVYLSVEMSDDAAVAHFFQISSDNIPLLENLYVNVFLTSTNLLSERESLLERTTGGGLVKAPRLRRLAVGSLWSSPLPLPIKWANLTELSLGPVAYQVDASFPLSTLAMCVNLTKCSIHHQAPAPVQHHGIPTHLMPFNPAVIPANPTIIQAASTSPNPTTPAAPNHSRHSGILRLPRLRTLELRGFEPPASFASALDLPSLRELIILCSSPPPVAEGVERGSIELIRKFGDGLTDVLVNSDPLNESSLLDIFEHLPNVVSFRLLGSSMLRYQSRMPSHLVLLDSVLEKLTPRYEYDGHGVVRGTCYCPKLEKFGCKANHDVGFSEEALVRFIAARRSRLHTDVAQLTSVVVAFPTRKPSKLIRDGLEELGVDLEDMVLITAYMKTQVREPHIPRTALNEFDVQDGIGDHEDWISTVRPFRQMLGDWVL